jgi:hypothetical protein
LGEDVVPESKSLVTSRGTSITGCAARLMNLVAMLIFLWDEKDQMVCCRKYYVLDLIGMVCYGN